jgi:hypothetical protein
MSLRLTLADTFPVRPGIHTARYAESGADVIFAPFPPDELRAGVAVLANLFISSLMLAAAAREARRRCPTPETRQWKRRN